MTLDSAHLQALDPFDPAAFYNEKHSEDISIYLDGGNEIKRVTVIENIAFAVSLILA